jgi:hypothetical protein
MCRRVGRWCSSLIGRRQAGHARRAKGLLRTRPESLVFCIDLLQSTPLSQPQAVLPTSVILRLALLLAVSAIVYWYLVLLNMAEYSAMCLSD